MINQGEKEKVSCTLSKGHVQLTVSLWTEPRAS